MLDATALDEVVSFEGGTPTAAVLLTVGVDPASGGTVTTEVTVDEVYPTLVVVTVHGTYVPLLNVLVTYEEVTVLVGCDRHEISVYVVGPIGLVVQTVVMVVGFS